MQHQAQKLEQSDLDDLLDESLGKKSSTTPDLELDLDGLLAESLEIVAAAKAGPSIRERLKRAQSATERKEIETTLRRWEAQHEWENHEECYLFVVQHCECGSKFQTAGGVFWHQRHRKDTHLERWVKVTPEAREGFMAGDAELPKRVLLTDEKVEFCAGCMNLGGGSYAWDKGVKL